MSTTESITQDSEVRGEGRSRRERGIYLYCCGAFERISKVPEVWRVYAPSGSVNDVEFDRGICTCKDHEHNGHRDGFMCKHQVAARLYARWLRKSARAMTYLFDGAERAR